MEITTDDLFHFLEKHEYHNKKVVTITKEQAQKLSLKELGCLIALNTIQSGRSKKDAIQNAECWIENGKDAIIKQFFNNNKVELM